MTSGMFSCASVRLRGWTIYVVIDFVALQLTDVCTCSVVIASSCAHLCKPGTFKWSQGFSGSFIHDIAPPAPGRFGISDPFSGVLGLSSLVCVCVHMFSVLELFSGPSHAPRPNRPNVLARKLRQPHHRFYYERRGQRPMAWGTSVDILQ